MSEQPISSPIYNNSQNSPSQKLISSESIHFQIDEHDTIEMSSPPSNDHPVLPTPDINIIPNNVDRTLTCNDEISIKDSPAPQDDDVPLDGEEQGNNASVQVPKTAVKKIAKKPTNKPKRKKKRVPLTMPKNPSRYTTDCKYKFESYGKVRAYKNSPSNHALRNLPNIRPATLITSVKKKIRHQKKMKLLRETPLNRSKRSGSISRSLTSSSSDVAKKLQMTPGYDAACSNTPPEESSNCSNCSNVVDVSHQATPIENLLCENCVCVLNRRNLSKMVSEQSRIVASPHRGRRSKKKLSPSKLANISETLIKTTQSKTIISSQQEIRKINRSKDRAAENKPVPECSLSKALEKHVTFTVSPDSENNAGSSNEVSSPVVPKRSLRNRKPTNYRALPVYQITSKEKQSKNELKDEKTNLTKPQQPVSECSLSTAIVQRKEAEAPPDEIAPFVAEKKARHRRKNKRKTYPGSRPKSKTTQKAPVSAASTINKGKVLKHTSGPPKDKMATVIEESESLKDDVLVNSNDENDMVKTQRTLRKRKKTQPQTSMDNSKKVAPPPVRNLRKRKATNIRSPHTSSPKKQQHTSDDKENKVMMNNEQDESDVTDISNVNTTGISSFFQPFS